jgi:uncharacterized protein (DUF3084 family)
VRTQKETAHVNLQQIQLEKRVNELNMDAVERELDSITAERERLEAELENRKKNRDFAEKNRAFSFTRKHIPLLKTGADEASAKWDKVKSAEGWVRIYKTVELVKEQFQKQDGTLRVASEDRASL